MKKILSALISLSLLVPMIAFAQATQCIMAHDVNVTGCPSSGACVFATNPLCGLCCVLNALYTATDWIFIVLMVVVALMVAWGGFSIATAAGAPEKVASGRNFILYSLIGLAVALLARALPALVKALLGVA